MRDGEHVTASSALATVWRVSGSWLWVGCTREVGAFTEDVKLCPRRHRTEVRAAQKEDSRHLWGPPLKYPAQYHQHINKLPETGQRGKRTVKVPTGLGTHLFPTAGLESIVIHGHWGEYSGFALTVGN